VVALVQTSLICRFDWCRHQLARARYVDRGSVLDLCSIDRVGRSNSLSVSCMAWRVMRTALLLVFLPYYGHEWHCSNGPWQASVSEQVPAEARHSAVALQASVTTLPAALGPAIGGV